MKAKHVVLVTLSFATAAAMAVPTRNIWQDARNSETPCTQTVLEEGWKYNDGDSSSVHCPRLQSQLSGTHEGNTLRARRVAREPQLDAASKKRLMGLMAILISARASH
jgi:hypothetical protein